MTAVPAQAAVERVLSHPDLEITLGPQPDRIHVHRQDPELDHRLIQGRTLLIQNRLLNLGVGK